MRPWTESQRMQCSIWIHGWETTSEKKRGRLKLCKDIVSASAMVFKLDTAAITYKKAVGFRPESARLKELLLQVADTDTKFEAKRKGLDASASYEQLCVEVKCRLLTLAPQHAHAALGRDAPDVVMGVSRFDEKLVEEETPTPTPEENPCVPYSEPGSAGDLDALGKGKSKGNGKGNPNACLRCGGEGHYSWACPTSRENPSNIKCHGCGGKAHVISACPTARPGLNGDKGGSKGGCGKPGDKGSKG